MRRHIALLSARSSPSGGTSLRRWSVYCIFQEHRDRRSTGYRSTSDRNGFDFSRAARWRKIDGRLKNPFYQAIVANACTKVAFSTHTSHVKCMHPEIQPNDRRMLSVGTFSTRYNYSIVSFTRRHKTYVCWLAIIPSFYRRSTAWTVRTAECRDVISTQLYNAIHINRCIENATTTEWRREIL